MRPIFCTECGRERGSGRADDRWYLFFTLLDGIDVVPFDVQVADFSEFFACGDEHALFMLSRWISGRTLVKTPAHFLPPFEGITKVPN